MKLLAKIQNIEAVENLESIIEAADGIVIERGYLGMEFRLEDSAFIVKHIINKCNSVNKPVILSTQILETMQKILRPSRADVCDVANAVLSGIDCLVLTGETATGPHFKEAT